MKYRTRLYRIIAPNNIYIVTVLVSFLLWLLPNDNGLLRKGFDAYFSPTLSGLIVCLTWILLVVLFSFVGFKVGKSIKLPTNLLNIYASIDSYRLFKVITLLGIIGTMYVFILLLKNLGIQAMVTALVGGQANTLKDSLYSDYKVGLASLRYMCIPAAALGSYHLTNRRYVFMSLVSIFSLMAIAIISSRLSIIYTIFIFLSLLFVKEKRKISKLQIILGATIIFHILCVLNYTRNINFYRGIGIDSFYAAGISEIVTYVGSPFQGFLAAGTLGDVLAKKSEEDTHSYTGISLELSTNSAFLELVRGSDVLSAFTIMSVSVLAGAFLMGIAIKNKNNILFLLFGIIGYCFAEIWRVYLFGQGIVYTMIITVILTAIFLIAIPKIKWRAKW